jgi:hypothetical protein
MSEEKEDSRLFIGKKLLHQVEDRDQTCAFWIISAISKFKSADPKMSMTCLFNILQQEMPNAKKMHEKYLRET